MTDRPLLGPTDPPTLSVMTWNVRRRLPFARSSSPDRWDRRRDAIRAVLRSERPAVLGVQEALPEQVEWIAASLGANWVGRGRDARGGGEHCALFYDPERLTLERWRQYALSDTPAVPGSRSWGNLWPRIFVVADFTDAATGAGFRVVNTHLDPLSARSRRRSAELLREVGRGTWPPLDAPRPTLLMGDANAGAGSPAHRILTGALVDTWDAAATRASPAWRTYSGFGSPRPGDRIDWLLTTPDVGIDAAAINAARPDGIAPSDHEPVQAFLRLPVRVDG
ncbi:endonuclease/exonuclease/phosphatase family protein [Microbacteriaceae bacterium 4G12]